MNKHIINTLVITPVLLTLAVACAKAPEVEEQEVVVVAPVQKPIYRSAKKVSTDCGVTVTADPPPGYAVPKGGTAKEMPAMISKFQAVGAERAMSETDSSQVSDGYVLIEPLAVPESMLLDNNKNIVTSFTGDYLGGFTQLLPNGNRLVSSNTQTVAFNDGGGYRGCIEEYASDGSLLWRLNLNTENYIHHHDVVKMDNGNILALVWEQVSVAEAVSQGRNPEVVAENGLFWYDGVIEVNPFTAEIVWEWSARHHLIQEFDAGKENYAVIADHPELLDINLFHASPSDGSVSPDWTHANALDYNPELDQIVWSSNYLNEVYVIDHSTTPYESIGNSGGRYGKGGDFLYRWGNPVNYGRGSQEDQKLFRQHDVQWIRPGLNGAGNILIFNNGDGKLRPYSTVIEFTPSMNADGSYDVPASDSFGPETLAWEYNPQPEEQFFSWFISGAQRLPNGNTFVNHGAAGKLREVTPAGEIVWEYFFTTDYTDAPHGLFRANRYPSDHPGVVALIGSK